jgi:hypothetical protein
MRTNLAFSTLMQSAVLAATLPLAANAHAAACDAPEFRAFDFWLGQWEVRTPDGKLAGHNAITREYGGCVVHERYSTGKGFSGESLNSYDAARGVWHQTWVDNTGTLLLIEGGVRDGRMVMEGPGAGPDGKPATQRITWTPNADGTLRQVWESRGANGVWSVVFDGTYTRSK